MEPPWEGRRIAHLDMDAFFASVELLARPGLRGRPVVVGGRLRGPEGPLSTYRGRGVVTTATYEARALGVHSGMGLMKAAALAPDALLLPADFEAYRAASRAFKDAVTALAPAMEDRGIDEVFLDLTEVAGETRDLGRRLKAAVREATGLTCSVGITPNKLLSKVASELDKPDGLTILGPDDVQARLWPLAPRVLGGVGPRAQARLDAMGIATLGQLAARPASELVATFGQAFGAWLAEAAWGRDDRPLVLSREAKSMSRETTFERDLHAVRDRERLGTVLLDLCTRLAADLDRHGAVARTVGVKVRYDDFRTLTRDVTLEAPAASAEDLRRAARACLRKVDLERPLRLLGVRAASLAPGGGPVAVPLF